MSSPESDMNAFERGIKVGYERGFGRGLAAGVVLACMVILAIITISVLLDE